MAQVGRAERSTRTLNELIGRRCAIYGEGFPASQSDVEKRIGNSPISEFCDGVALCTVVVMLSGPSGRVRHGVLMLVKQFKFKRNNDKGRFQWTAESEIEHPGF